MLLDDIFYLETIPEDRSNEMGYRAGNLDVLRQPKPLRCHFP
jgi:hypothetical protein